MSRITFRLTQILDAVIFQRVKTWRILDYGKVAENSSTIPYECVCGYEAELPVLGRVIAMTSGGGVIFDNDQKGFLPAEIQCRKCRRIYSNL